MKLSQKQLSMIDGRINAYAGPVKSLRWTSEMTKGATAGTFDFAVHCYAKSAADAIEEQTDVLRMLMSHIRSVESEQGDNSHDTQPADQEP